MNRKPTEQRLMHSIIEDNGQLTQKLSLDHNTKVDQEFLDKLKILSYNNFLVKEAEDLVDKGDRLVAINDNPNFKIRDDNFYRHQFGDKVIMLDKVETTMHKKLDAKVFLGIDDTKGSDFLEAIRPIDRTAKFRNILLEQQLKNDVPMKMRKAEQRVKEQEKVFKMVNTYKDRLLPRYKV